MYVLPYRTLFRQTAQGGSETYSWLRPSWGNRFTFHLINTHIETRRTITVKHTDSYVQTQKGTASHLAYWWKHFCEELEWHQLHSDKNGFGPSCWLSNTFWCSSSGRFIRSQIICLTFTPKHIMHAERQQAELMHSITRCTLLFCFIWLLSKYLITSGRFQGIRK